MAASAAAPEAGRFGTEQPASQDVAALSPDAAPAADATGKQARTAAEAPVQTAEVAQAGKATPARPPTNPQASSPAAGEKEKAVVEAVP